MPVVTGSPAPYAPASAILEVVTRYRSRGLPAPIDGDVLGRAGISQSLIPRTLQALQALDLIDEKGAPTNILEGLRLAPEAEYKQRLAEWLNRAYADVLQFIDPATADETAIRDAFRSYQPIGQQARMVTLFIGLYAAAGIGPEKTSQPRAARPSRPRPTPTPTPKTNIGKSARSSSRSGDAVAFNGSGIPAPLAGLLSGLPVEGKGWTKERREKFLTTFAAVLDFCFPIVTQEAAENEEDEDAAA